MQNEWYLTDTHILQKDREDKSGRDYYLLLLLLMLRTANNNKQASTMSNNIHIKHASFHNKIVQHQIPYIPTYQKEVLDAYGCVCV